MTALVRFGLLIAALIVCGAIIAVHGVRGVVFVVVIMAVATVPQTGAWRATEGALIRVTGSRRRAWVLVMAVLICVLVVVNVYQYTRQ
jgi:hypothetical protein